MPDTPSPPSPNIRFLVEGLRIATRGLRELEHPELALEVTIPAELLAARALLLSLATEIVLRRHRFRAGETLPYAGEVLRLEESTLELSELDPLTGAFVAGAPRLLASLQEGS